MPSSLTIIRQREHRRNRRRRGAEGRLGRVVFGIGFLLSAVLVLGVVATAMGYADLTDDLPPVDELPILLNAADGSLLEPTRIYDRSGNNLLAVLAPEDERRVYVPYDQLPQALIDATLALADPGFTKHAGFVLTGWQDAETHATLAQRLASDLLLWDETPSPRRGLRERLLAAQLTDRYGREKVIEWYLNSADYGNSAFGVEAAAQLYLGKHAAGLDLGESALLAAVSQAPALNPFDSPESTEELRVKTLQEMLLQGRITPEDASAAAFTRPVVRMEPASEPRQETAFTNLVLEQLGERFDPVRIRRGGLMIVTTLDSSLQAQATSIVETELGRLSGGSSSALILDAQNGQVLAAVGDLRAGETGEYLQSHPAGTLLTPFIYLSAFTRGLSPASLGWDIPGSAANFDGQYRGAVRLRSALVNDMLPPAEAILMQMGMDDIVRIAAQFGVTLPAGTDLLKDEILLSPLEAAAVYAVFANQGTLAGQQLGTDAIQPVSVLRVSAVDGAVWADWNAPETQAVVSPQLAYLLTDVLSDSSVRLDAGERGILQQLTFPAAFKSGRSFDLSGAWAAGYSPRRVVIVHVSAVDVPGSAALDLWQALMTRAQGEAAIAPWTKPTGLTTLEVCEPSGLLPTDACPNAVSELFLAGNEPIQADTLFKALEVNRETGLLATVFTPLELVEERTYMLVPPEATAWAEASGLPVPPVEYDALRSLDEAAEVRITSPEMFREVAGVVDVRGSAGGQEFASYRLDYGQGLNPGAWVQIGTDSDVPVEAGLLGRWDTSGLAGAYVLRLQVVRSGLRVEQSMRVVTVTEP